MRKGLVLALFLIGAGSGVAFAEDKPADSDFATKAAQGGMAEVKLSKLAETKAMSAEVKKFAKKMVVDHTHANAELTKLAGKKSITLPAALDDDHQKAFEKLSSLTGEEFDKQYMKNMSDDHDDTVKLFKDEVDHGKDADLKSFALRTLPVIEKHDNMAHHDETVLKK